MTLTRLVFGGLFAVLLVLGAVAGCGSTVQAGGGTSGVGQSCTRTYDCASGDTCISNVCVSATAPVGDAGADGTAMATGPQLGQKGDACQTNFDCGSGLVCVGSSAGGICDLANYNLPPSSNVCGECKTGADCCELPTGLSLQTYVLNDAGFDVLVAAHTCQDLLDVFLGGSQTGCASAYPGGTLSKACFYYDTYCTPGCTATTWTCTNNRCLYAGMCTTDAFSDDQGGCPSRSRTTYTLATTCNPTTHTCGGTTSNNCVTGADCNGQHPADSTSYTCVGDDCACNQGACYVACVSTLDCPFGYKCDATTQLCTAQSACAIDSDCALLYRDVQAKCVSGVCKAPCTTDRDCSPSGAIPGGGTFNGDVCQGGFCTYVGCTSDLDCASGNLHDFCVPPPATTTGTGVVSAVTN